MNGARESGLRMKKGLTLKDIAGKLRMSVSTVSKALSNDASISAATKERVKKLADEWHYIPNEAARNFKQNKTFTLGLIIPDLLDQFYVLAINGVEKIAAQKKYNVIISQSHEDVAQEKQIVDTMMRNRVDGVIVAISKHTTDMSCFRKLVNTGIPVVFFARAPTEDLFNYVSSKNEDGTLKAMNFLFGKGHTRIGHLMGPSAMPVTHIRLKGYKKALQKNGLPYEASLVKATDFTTHSTYEAMKALMSLPFPPTALFVFKNYVSLDVIRYLQKNHPEALEQMDIVGFGNLPLFQFLNHKPAASIDENSYTMGIEAARLIFQQIESGQPASEERGRHITVACKLVIHERNEGR